MLMLSAMARLMRQHLALVMKLLVLLPALALFSVAVITPSRIVSVLMQHVNAWKKRAAFIRYQRWPVLLRVRSRSCSFPAQARLMLPALRELARAHCRLLAALSLAKPSPMAAN